jgi:hypothetical protein
MKFNSIINEIIHRFSSIDIIIEPEESAVREAVNKLKGADPKYFDGVKKVVVEHGNPKSPYLGKATGDGIVYISLDAIKNQLKTQGVEEDRQALINELVKTLGHEVTHIRGGMQPTEAPSEVEEHVLEQRFPTPELKREAADLSDKQRRSIALQKEIADLRAELNRIQSVWKQLTRPGVTIDPAREAHFKGEQDRLNAELAAKRAELASLDAPASSPAEQPSEAAEPAPQAATAPVAPSGEDVAKYAPILEELSASLGSALAGLNRLQQILSNAPTFVRGEVDILARLRKAVSAMDSLHKKTSSRAQASIKAPHLLGRLALERLFEDAQTPLLEISDFLTSENDFIRPLTNQGVESEFYTAAVAPVVADILSAIKAAADRIGGEHRILLQIPDPSTSLTAKPPSPNTGPSKERGSQPRGERTLAAIREDYVAEYKELSGKLEEARGLLRATADQEKLAPLLAKKTTSDAELRSAKQDLEAASVELNALMAGPQTKDKLAQQKDASARYRDAKRRVELADAESNRLRTEIASLYDSSAVNPDTLIAAIAPYSNVASVEMRLQTIADKLEKFKTIDEYKKQLADARDELRRRAKELGDTHPEVAALTKLVEYALPEQISDLEGELGAVSAPKPRSQDPEMIRVRDTLKENMKSFNSPLVRSMFEKIMPDVATGGMLRGQKKTLERKLQVRTKDVAPETDYERLDGIIPADVEISKWKSQIGTINRDIAHRQSGEMLEYMGRLGQALSALVQRAGGKADAQIPADILGPSLILGKYSKSDGNNKIIRDLESVVSANAKVAAMLEAEFNKLQAELSNLEKSAEKDPVIAERLRAKRKYLAEQPAFQKFRSDVSSTIDRLIQQTHPVSTEEIAPAKTIRERGWAPEISKKVQREERDIAKEFGWGSEPVESEPWRFPQYDERAKALSRRWETPEPLGRAALTGAIRRDIELGLIDPSAIPQDVRKGLLDRLHVNSKEMRDIKERLAEPDAELARLRQERASFESGTAVDPEFNRQRLARNRIEQETVQRRSARLRERARQLHSEIGKIRDLLKNPQKYVESAEELEKMLESLLEKRDKLYARKYGDDKQLNKLQKELSSAPPSEQRSIQDQIAVAQKSITDLEFDIQRIEREVANVERRLGAVRSQPAPSSPESTRQRGRVRVFEPTEEDKLKIREHRQRYEGAVERGVAEKAKKYRAADKAELAAMYRRREFVDPNNPSKQLPSTRMLNASRAMRYAYKKALELNPASDTSRESRVRAALYKQTELDNYLRMLDDEYLKQATERAEVATSDAREQFRLRAQYLDELHRTPEYVQAIEMLQQAMSDIDRESIIDRPEGVAALEAVVEERDMGRGVGRVRGRPERMLGAKDPYMLFFRAQYEAEVALMRYERAAKAKKQLDAARAKARAKASAEGLDEKQIKAIVDKEYNELLGAIMASQYESLSKFDNIVEKLKDAAQGKQPSVYFDPSKVSEYLKELTDKQASVVREKELARRFTQVRETPLVTAEAFDPDRYPKLMAVEFSDELPTVSEFARQQSEGEGVYKKLRYVLPHILWGKKTPEKKSRGKTPGTPATPGAAHESPFTETVKHKYHPAPIRPGGKGQRGDKVPQFMQSKSRK